MTTATGTITLEIPIALAPLSLSKNGRAHWRVRNHDFQTLKQWALYALIQDTSIRLDEPPWLSAWMDIDWRFTTGRTPDDDNIITRLSAVRDAFEEAAIVRNDQHIRIRHITITRISRTDDPIARVTLERA